MKNTDSGSQLLQRINAREPKALEELYQLLFWPCAKVVTKDGGSLDEAKEVFHQAIFSLMIKLQSPDFSLKKNLKGYLYKSCFNIWVNNKLENRRKVVNQQDMVQETDQIEKKLEKEELYQRLHQCTQRMSDACKKLLHLYFYQKKRDQEIAQLLNYSAAFVKTKRSRCLKELRKRMDS